MAKFQDFLLDDDGDLMIANGDFVVGPSDMQHVQDIIESFAGSWKQYPILGVGIKTFLKSENGQAAVTLIKQQLQSDGYSVGNIKVKNDVSGLQVSFDPNIKRNT